MNDELVWLARVAESYRALAMRLDAHECEKLDIAISEADAARNSPVENPDRMVTVKVAALELGVTVDTVNGWSRQHPDKIRREVKNKRAYLHLGDLVDFRQSRKNRSRFFMS